MSIAQQLVLICAFSSSASIFAMNVSLSNPSLPTFASFISTHGRTYKEGTSEYDMRRGIYEKRVEEVKNHNRNPHRLWNAVVNHLTDHTEAELKKLRGLKMIRARPAGVIGAHKPHTFLSQVQNAVLPNDVNWGHLSAVQQDINQQACGSCWAIATSIMLQAHAEIKKQQRTFSAQELVDCVPNPHNCGGSGGCDGATVELGMNWIMDKGLDTREGTPYLGSDSQCKKSAPSPEVLLGNEGVSNIDNSLEAMIHVGFHPANSKTSPGYLLGLKGWERLPENDYTPLLQAVATRGPVAVSVGADSWNSYGGGIFNGCSPNAVVDHAVTLIGYGSELTSGMKYWHIKNSWSNGWGEDGNIRMLRHEGKTYCGVDDNPKEGTGCDGGPSKVTVCGMCGILYDSVVPHMV